MNILDLGFFSSIQPLQEKESTKNENDLTAAVPKPFDDVTAQTLLKNFVTLKEEMKEIILYNGSNNFKIPHVKKSERIGNGEDIATVYCDTSAVKAVEDFLRQHVDV